MGTVRKQNKVEEMLDWVKQKKEFIKFRHKFKNTENNEKNCKKWKTKNREHRTIEFSNFERAGFIK